MHRSKSSVLWVASLALVGSAALAADAPRKSGDPGRANSKVVVASDETTSTTPGVTSINDQSNSEHRPRGLRARSGNPAAKECDARSVLQTFGRVFGMEFELACYDQR
jgi:hypothetical protein